MLRTLNSSEFYEDSALALNREQFPSDAAVNVHDVTGDNLPLPFTMRFENGEFVPTEAAENLFTMRFENGEFVPTEVVENPLLSLPSPFGPLSPYNSCDYAYETNHIHDFIDSYDPLHMHRSSLDDENNECRGGEADFDDTDSLNSFFEQMLNDSAGEEHRSEGTIVPSFSNVNAANLSAPPVQRAPVDPHTVGPLDVKMGRGTGPRTHEGNIWLRAEVDRGAKKTRIRYRYLLAGRKGTTAIADELIQKVYERGGRFMELDEHNQWNEVFDAKKIRDKATDLLRGKRKYWCKKFRIPVRKDRGSYWCTRNGTRVLRDR